MKLLEYRSKITGHSIGDLIYKDQVVVEALTYISFYERMRKGMFPDKEFQEEYLCDIERIVDRIKKETPNAYNELYKNLNDHDDYFFGDKNIENSKEKKKQKPFTRVVDEIVEKDFKINYLCDSFVDEALKIYDVIYGDVRFE